MTLSKQLGLGFFSVLTLVFIGTLYTNVSNTRFFIEQQLSSHAQDTATSLGLSISPYISNYEDIPIIETMTNAIFDRGYYLSIELQSIDGSVIVSRINPEQQDLVPKWFSQLFSINAPAASTEINDGWNIKGNLVVVTHPGFGYLQLWNNAVGAFWVTLMVFVLALIFVWGLVKHVITEPIDNVIKQTDAIVDKQFSPISEIPRTPELKRFVLAINFMSNKLQHMFQQLSEQAEKYRLFAYTDPLTKVGNRRAFEMTFDKTLRNEAEHPEGHIFIIRASSLADVNNELGGEIGDNYLVKTCSIAQKITAEHVQHFSIYRLAGADFALLIENTTETQIKSLAKALSLAYKQSEKTEHKSGMAHIGISEFTYGLSTKDVLEKVDSALAIAGINEHRWELANSLTVSFSNETWREKIQDLIKLGTSDFASQPIVNKNKDIAYSEWFARLPNKESSANLPMAQLVPASIRLDYAQELDTLIVQNLLSHLSEQHTSSSELVGLNISRMSLFDTAFMQWFTEELQNAGALGTKLVLEIPERALVHDIDKLVMQLASLKSMGVKIAVEHFGAQLAGITHIRKLQPDFLKLDGRFTRNIEQEIDNQLFLQSLLTIAQGLNIKVIAEMVETENEVNWLLNAGVDYVQGYFIAAPSSVAT